MKEIIDLIQESYKVKIPKEKLKQEIEETYYFENTKERWFLINHYNFYSTTYKILFYCFMLNRKTISF